MAKSQKNQTFVLKININWISPYCDDCINRFNNIEFIDINEYYGGENNGSY